MSGAIGHFVIGASPIGGPLTSVGMSWNSLTGASNQSGAIANWMSKFSISSGPGGVADNILQEACSWIYRRLRHWRMLSVPTPFTMSVGSDVIPFPTGFLEPLALWYLNGSPFWMTQKEPNQVYQRWLFDGSGVRVPQPPMIYSFNGAQLQMDSPSDQAYAGWIVYYQQPPALSSTNPTNFLTDSYQRLLRCACMAGACEWAKDNGQGQFDRTYWDTLAEDEIYKAQAESDRARRGEVNAAVMIGGGGDSGYPAYGGFA
jgi:hypothetical protein